MKRLVCSLAILALLGTAACTSNGEIVYTGQNEEAREGDYIKDPEARGSTRDRAGREEITRTNSNRVDIPVVEFAAATSWSDMRGAYRRSGYEARYVRQEFAAGRYVDYTETTAMVEGYEGAATAESYFSRRNNTIYPGFVSNERLSARLGRETTRAYSAQERPWADKTRHTTEAMKSDARVSAMRGEAYVEGMKNEQGFEGAWGSRVIGLHLWKYADRELVADNVEITYTIVYYNTNEYNTGPTVIDEPVPYYTEYIPESATLPKEGTTVQYIDRDTRDLLRWNFPQGIKPGETNRMTYKVTVNLGADYERRPPEDRPSMPGEDQ